MPTPRIGSVDAPCLVLAAAMLTSCAEPSTEPDAAVADTWWERIDDPGAWWLKGGKDPKPAVTVASCDDLQPGFVALRASGVEALEGFNGTVEGCDLALSWLSWWPSQLVQKQLSAVSGCRRCDLESWDGFRLEESLLHLQLVRHGDRLEARFDSRWPPDLDEVSVGPTALGIAYPDGGTGWGTLDTECPDGSRARECASFEVIR